MTAILPRLELVPEAQGYVQTISAINVHRMDANPVFAEGLTKVRIEDEAGGCFVVLEQEDGSVRLDFDEVEMVVQAIARLRAQTTVTRTLDRPGKSG